MYITPLITASRGAGAEDGTAPCNGNGQPLDPSRRLFFQSNRLCKCQRVAKREKNKKRGPHCEAKRTAVHAAPTTLCSGPRHPLPLFWPSRLRCPPSRFDRHRLSSLGTNLDEPCKCWDWECPHYVSIPPYISVFTGSMDTVKDILPSKLTTPRQTTTTQVCTVFGPRPAVNSGDQQAGCRKRGCSRRRGLVVGSRKDKLQVAGACSLPARGGT